MPRTKKAPGQAIDRRNGRRAEVGVSVLAPLDPPPDLCDEARAQWDAYWSDAVASVRAAADRGVVLRWIDAINRYLRTLGEADRQPLIEGSTGQLTENPLYRIADRALGTIERCEKQLGIGSLNRAGLGIAVITERRSLADMNARYGGANDNDDKPAASDEADPRLALIEGESA